jgi:hypothetical protein
MIMAVMFAACDQTDHSITEDPYAGGKAPLGVQLLGDAPKPSNAYPGDTVVFKAKGLLQWCDPANKRYDFEFYLSDEKVEIVSADESSISVLIPENISTGISYILMQGQVFYGPKLTILGNIRIDSEYGIAATGANGTVFCYLPHSDKSGDIYLGGEFMTVSGAARNGIALINSRGILVAQQNTKYAPKTPLLSGGTVTSLSYFSDGKVLASGTFDYYENLVSPNNPVMPNNIVTLNANFSPVTYIDTIYTNNTMTRITLAVFNGGTEETIIRSFVTKGDSVIAVANSDSYCRYNYDYSNRFNYLLEYTTAGDVMKMNGTGQLDTVYRKGLAGANALISDACKDKNDAVLLVGEFTSFDGAGAPHIVKLDAAGNIDRTFMDNIGQGANNNIDMIRYNEKLGKIVLTGRFTSFNGEARNGVAILNGDGTLEPFNIKEIVGGAVNFAAMLDLEKIVISGTFTKYDGVSRGGFLILETDGTAIQHFNVPGAFNGQLFQVFETETTIGSYGILLMGSFNRFNGQKINNITMIEVDFED